MKVGRFPFVGNGKAIALGEDQGMVKVVFDTKTGELLGAHMIGAEVTEPSKATPWRCPGRPPNTNSWKPSSRIPRFQK